MESCRGFKELESPLWVRKMKTLFRVMDADGDGFMSLEDNQAPPKRMTEAFNLSKEEADAVLEYTRRVGWIEFVNAGTEPPKGHRVSEKTFLENMARAVNSQDVAVPLAESHVVMFDLKEQGFITKEEYLKVFRSLAVPEELAVQQFEMIDSDNDGRITVEDYTKVFRFFFTDLEHTDDPRNNIFGPLIPKELESPLWVRKMKTLFRVMDTDGDGFMSLEDNQAPP